MMQNVTVVHAEADALSVVWLMTRRGLQRVIVQQEGKLVGIITRFDVIRHLILADLKVQAFAVLIELQQPLGWVV